MRTIHTDKIIRSIRDMCIEANLTLSKDMKCRLKSAKEAEKTPLGKQILCQLNENMKLPKKNRSRSVRIRGWLWYF